MPPLQNRTTHNNTPIQLHKNKHTSQGHGFMDGPRGGGELLAEWKGATNQQMGLNAG